MLGNPVEVVYLRVSGNDGQSDLRIMIHVQTPFID
jgi:hypothetical protein